MEDKTLNRLYIFNAWSCRPLFRRALSYLALPCLGVGGNPSQCSGIRPQFTSSGPRSRVACCCAPWLERLAVQASHWRGPTWSKGQSNIGEQQRMSVRGERERETEQKKKKWCGGVYPLAPPDPQLRRRGSLAWLHRVSGNARPDTQDLTRKYRNIEAGVRVLAPVSSECRLLKATIPLILVGQAMLRKRSAVNRARCRGQRGAREPLIKQRSRVN